CLSFLYPELEEKLVRQRALGERVEDTYDISIAFVPGPGRVWINSVDVESELDEGQKPDMTIHCGKEATGIGTGVKFDIYDMDTGALVCRVGLIFPSVGTFSHHILPGAWIETMPARAWNLRIEAILWWL
ncbi:unnamed protein product, partial [marine sediment metagenome]